MARKAVTLNAFMRRVQAQIFPREQLTRRGRATRDYRDGKLAQTKITFSTEDEVDALREKLRRYLKPHCYKGTRVRHLDREQQRWLLRTLVEAYYTEGYSDLVYKHTSIDAVIEELVARRVVPEPWSDEYKGKGLYSGQVGSEEKALERVLKGVERANATRRSEAIETRENDLDGGAAAPGLAHSTSHGRHMRRKADELAEELGLEPPDNENLAKFLRKHGPKPTGNCDACLRPLASSVDALGQRRPVQVEHVKGGHHEGRLRSCCKTDEGCNHAERAAIDAMNRSLHAAGQPPLKAEEADYLGNLHLAACYRLPQSDPNRDELMREVEASQAAAAVATWTERHQRATVASTTRSDADLGQAREKAITERRERLAATPSHVAAACPKARAAYSAKKQKKYEEERAKHEAKLAALREKYHAGKGKPRAPRVKRSCYTLPPAPAPRRKRHCPVSHYNPTEVAAEAQLASCPYYAAAKRKAAAKPAKKRARR
jgi:hypothetical protein